jgi:23S rRNA (uracil1939-C5)-methyltransferase
MTPPESNLPVAPPAASAGARVECAHAERCGGCPAISMSYGEQLAMKRGRVVQSVARYTGLELVYTEPVAPAEPIEGYRARAKLIVAPGGQIGLYAKGGGHHVVDIPGCKVLAPVLAKVAAAVRERAAVDEASGGPLAPFDPSGQRRGALRAIDLREVRDGDPKVLLTFVVQRAVAPSLDALREAARSIAEAQPDVAGVAVNFHEGDAPQILGSETIVLYGAQSARDVVGRSRHLATYGSFVQAHRGQASRIHQMIQQALGLDKPGAGPIAVLDLYGGSGAIALGLASAGARVHLVESFAPAAAQALAAAKEQGLSMTTEASDAAAALQGIVREGRRFDAVVVNPPRRGMSAAAREWLARLEAPVVAYVSCDPDTLARDLDHFTRLGYAPASLRPVDMIPLTEEIETVAVLRRANAPLPRVVFEDEEILVVEKSPHEPTAPQPEYSGSLLARVRRIPRAENAVPVHRIDIGTSGLVMFARRPDLAGAWQEALLAPSTRKIFVAATRGVTPSKGAITRELREEGKLYPARTRYRRLAVAGGHSVLRVIPEQGRTHQIRRHLAAIGHPVLGDDRYGHPPTNRFFEEKNGLDRAFLHCVRIEIDHIRSGNRLVMEAPLPGDLRAVLERVSGPGTLRFLDHKNALGGSGVSSLPPAPSPQHERGSALSIDTSSITRHPEIVESDDDDLGGGRSSGGF